VSAGPWLDALQASGDALALPHPDCYWVIPGRLLAGSYPAMHLEALLDASMHSFIDLTRSNESLAPYALELQGRARWHGFAITDYAVPDVRLMCDIVQAIDTELAAARNVYLHCHAGVGRTGTAVGCWLVQQGLGGAAALALIAHKRAALTRQGAPVHSPETDAQRGFVLHWAQHEAPS
jgi:protein tyrosine/serine phosphatase